MLSDCRVVFQHRGADRLPTETLVEALVALEDAPWVDMGYGRTLTATSLATLLRPYGIRPKQIRLDSVDTRKGYSREAFLDVWDRYLRDTLSFQDGKQAKRPKQATDGAKHDPKQQPDVSAGDLDGCLVVSPVLGVTDAAERGAVQESDECAQRIMEAIL
jgi:hypothetical protein